MLTQLFLEFRAMIAAKTIVSAHGVPCDSKGQQDHADAIQLCFASALRTKARANERARALGMINGHRIRFLGSESAGRCPEDGAPRENCRRWQTAQRTSGSACRSLREARLCNPPRQPHAASRE